jgi:hypothetical protein
VVQLDTACEALRKDATETRRHRDLPGISATVSSPTARRLLAGIGYSDDVTVLLNGEPLYRGVNGWESRGPEHASVVDARYESVGLPLLAGDNELMLAVTDDQRFGWGFAVKLDDTARP